MVFNDVFFVDFTVFTDVAVIDFAVASGFLYIFIIGDISPQISLGHQFLEIDHVIPISMHSFWNS
jgi:hypothetical protein